MNSCARDRLIAVSAVVLAQVIFIKLLLSIGIAAQSTRETPPLRVRFVEREKASAHVDVASERSPGSPSPGRTNEVRDSVQPRLPAQAGRTGILNGHDPMHELVLDLSLAEIHAPDFSRQVLKGDSRLERLEPPPERIPMRTPITGKDIIEGASQILGFWPPGYTTDPCPQIRRNIGALMADSSEAGRARLASELERRENHCK